MNTALISSINSIITSYAPSSDRNSFITLVVARSIAFNLQLPSSRLKNVYDFYISSHLETVDGIVCKLNELSPIPVAAILKAVRELWVARYRIVFDPNHEQAKSLMNCVLGCDTSLYGADTLKYLNTDSNSACVQSAANDLQDILEAEFGLPTIPVEDSGLSVSEPVAAIQ